MHVARAFGVIVVIAVAQSTPIVYGKDGNEQANKEAGPGLWNSIGENLKTYGEALPVTVHLHHETKPTLLRKDSIKIMVKGKHSKTGFGHKLYFLLECFMLNILKSLTSLIILTSGKKNMKSTMNY